MAAQPKMSWLDRALYTLRGSDGHCNSCIHGHGQSCRRYAPRESQTARPRFVDILEPSFEWCGEHKLDRSLLDWNPVWRRKVASLRLRLRLRRERKRWEREIPHPEEPR